MLKQVCFIPSLFEGEISEWGGDFGRVIAK